MNLNYNKGVVWGLVEEVQYRTPRTAGKKPSAKLTLLCVSEQYGKVKAYGRLWGGESCANLKAILKHFPNDPIRFEGFFTQYKKRGTIYTGYNFIQCETTSDTHRASFILTGKCVGKVTKSDEPYHEALEIQVEQYNQPGKFNVFQIFAEPETADKVPMSSIVQVNGSIMERDAEFGGSGFSRPVLKQFFIRQRQAQTSEVF